MSQLEWNSDAKSALLTSSGNVMELPLTVKNKGSLFMNDVNFCISELHTVFDSSRFVNLS